MRDMDSLIRALDGPRSVAPPPTWGAPAEESAAHDASLDELLRRLEGPRSRRPAPDFAAPEARLASASAAPEAPLASTSAPEPELTPANSPFPDFRESRLLPPVRSRPRWWASALITALCGVAAGLAVSLLVDDPGAHLRGVPGTPVVDLRMAVDRGDDLALRVSAGGGYHVGDKVFFRLSVTPSADVRVWVDGPTGRTRIAEVRADAAPADIRSDQGLVAWQFDGPGRYTFTAGAVGDEACRGCAHLEVEVR